MYEIARNQPIHAELDYSLTLFQIEVSDTIAALNGDKRIAILGGAGTELDYNGNTVRLGCIKPGNGDNPACATVVLENTVSGQQNPTSNQCFANYAPFTNYEHINVMQPFGRFLSVRDPQGLAKYPVDNSQLANAQVSLKSYKPVAHFTRQLIIPEIRLGDWEADTHKTATSTTTPPQ